MLLFKRTILIAASLIFFSVEVHGAMISQTQTTAIPGIAVKQVSAKTQPVAKATAPGLSLKAQAPAPATQAQIAKIAPKAATAYQLNSFQVSNLKAPLRFKAGSTLHLKDGAAYLENQGKVWRIRIENGGVRYTAANRSVLSELTTRIGFSGAGTLNFQNGTVTLTGDGDLYLEGRFDFRRTGGAVNLQIQAAGNIQFQGSISSPNTLNVSMNSQYTNLNGDVRTNGGNFTSTGSGFYASSDVVRSEINTGAGNITIRQKENITIESLLVSTGKIILDAPEVVRR